MKIYERKSFPRTVRDLGTMMNSGKLSFENAVQRSFVWKNTTKDNRMSMLIDSVIRGFPIPPMYCNCVYTNPKDKVYDFIDGKQRVTTLVKFLNDDFELIGIPTYDFEEGNEVDFNGKKYSELPEEVRDNIRTYSLTVYYYENMCQDDVEEMFRRLNNGKSLTAIELTRVGAKSKHQIAKLAHHPLFNLILSEKSLSGYANEDIIIKTWILIYQNNKSLETKNIRPVMSNANITDEQIGVLNNCFSMFENVYKKIIDSNNSNSIRIGKRIITKTHMLSIMPIMYRCLKQNISEEVICNWIKNFFCVGKNATVSEIYNSNATSGSAKVDAVQARLIEIDKSFDNFITNSLIV